MGMVEDIKERAKQKYGAIPDGITDSTAQLQATDDVSYLLSKLEIAENALLVLTTRTKGLILEHNKFNHLTDTSIVLTEKIIVEIEQKFGMEPRG